MTGILPPMKCMPLSVSATAARASESKVTLYIEDVEEYISFCTRFTGPTMENISGMMDSLMCAFRVTKTQQLSPICNDC